MIDQQIFGPRPRSVAELIEWIDTISLGATPESQRAGFARIMQGQIPGSPDSIGGVPGLCVGSGNLKAVWFHGGGYVFGSSQTHTYSADILAKKIGGRIFLPNYRLAPEHAWPAQFEDAQAVILGSSSPIAVIGDSAGGHLALQTALEHRKMISRLILFSPNTDRTGLSSTRSSHAHTDRMNDPVTDRKLFDLACPKTSPDSVEASPVLGNYENFPPTYISVGDKEVLLDDALLLANRIERAGARLQLDVWPDLWHMFWQWPDLFLGAQSSLSRAAKFILN